MNCEMHVTTDGPTPLLSLNRHTLGAFEQGYSLVGFEPLDKDGMGGGGLDFEHWMVNIRYERPSLIEAIDSLASKGFPKDCVFRPVRVKIEVEYCEDINPEDALYLETHFDVTPEEAKAFGLPVSRNIMTGKLSATDRCYDNTQFRNFALRNTNMGRKLEYCVLDSCLDYDEYWIEGTPKLKSPISTNFSKAYTKKVKAMVTDFGCR
jgi:hypothetical protein